MADDQELLDPSQDPAFRAASMKRKVAYLSSIDADFAKASPQRQAQYINHLLGNDQQTQFEKQNSMSNRDRDLNSFATGALSSASGLAESQNPVEDAVKASAPTDFTGHIIQGLKSSLGPLPQLARTGYEIAKEGFTPQQEGETDQDVAERRSHALGSAAGQVAPMLIGPVREGIADHFAETPEVAAQRALRPEPKQAEKFQDSLPNAQAYLKGSSDLADLQSRIPGAKNEIWQPYQQALDNIGSQAVNGPDGLTTYADLEKQRLEASAQLQSFRKMRPVDQQGIVQKNQGIADLTRRYADITGPLDDGLRSQGIDPEAVRSTFGDIQGINRLTQGRNTLSEPDKRYGFGRMSKTLNPLHPLKSFGGVIEGTKDLLAGRPWWSGKPTDVMVREGFRSGPDKPDFGTPAPPTMPAVPVEPSDLPASDSPSSFRVGSPEPPVPSYSPSRDQDARGSVIEMSPTLPPPTMPEVPRTAPIEPDVEMPLRFRDNATGIEHSVPPDELDSAANALYGAEKYEHLTPEQKSGLLRFAQGPTRTSSTIDVTPSSPTTLPPPTLPAIPSTVEGAVAQPTGVQGAIPPPSATPQAPSPFQASQLIRKPIVPPQQ